MIPGGIIGHEGGPCIILLLVPLGPVNILYLVWGTDSDVIFGPMGPLLGGTSFTVTDMTRLCGGVTGGWMRVVYLDKTNSSQNGTCPMQWSQGAHIVLKAYMQER